MSVSEVNKRGAKGSYEKGDGTDCCGTGPRPRSSDVSVALIGGTAVAVRALGSHGLLNGRAVGSECSTAAGIGAVSVVLYDGGRSRLVIVHYHSCYPDDGCLAHSYCVRTRTGLCRSVLCCGRQGYLRVTLSSCRVESWLVVADVTADSEGRRHQGSEEKQHGRGLHFVHVQRRKVLAHGRGDGRGLNYTVSRDGNI